MTNGREDEVRKWGMTGRHCCDGSREGGTSQLDPSLKWATGRGGGGAAGKKESDSGKYQQVALHGNQRSGRRTYTPFSPNQMHVPPLSTLCGTLLFVY